MSLLGPCLARPSPDTHSLFLVGTRRLRLSPFSILVRYFLPFWGHISCTVTNHSSTLPIHPPLAPVLFSSLRVRFHFLQHQLRSLEKPTSDGSTRVPPNINNNNENIYLVNPPRGYWLHRGPRLRAAVIPPGASIGITPDREPRCA
jgi:hypothetical protein